jgi:hypothetical protein
MKLKGGKCTAKTVFINREEPARGIGTKRHTGGEGRRKCLT